ncbi:hypothetical protein NE237_012629 [Protea cynaroides]|uniref:Homeobox protein knotted-1-like 1 n=1 Tax=Protea cynaroides TaxID=273540 RepID=A0A9Q0JXS9_9MAGN|nr:hypothetical protein NE237_012629 [Protea cynaroides]
MSINSLIRDVLSFQENGYFISSDGDEWGSSDVNEITGVGSIAPDLFQFEANSSEISGSEMSRLIKAQIANHPLYPSLVSAYIECRKYLSQVGAPQKLALLLEEIARENHPSRGGSCEFGADPELDEFMESYCEALYRYKEELSKPFDEARTFLNNIETQLSDLCKLASSSTTTTTTFSSGNYQSAPGTSEDELSCGEAEAEAEALDSMDSSSPQSVDKELKEMLLRKYSGYISSLRKEFLKKRKKVKLPKDARMALSDWWNNHYRWPYPTEEEKKMLSQVTGLDQKQISNWFINQRKRHWKPSEDMRALMEGGTCDDYVNYHSLSRCLISPLHSRMTLQPKR